jgi:hypothetical protein
MATYYDLFGQMPLMTGHLVKRMNEVGISPSQLTTALMTQARPGTSPGTIMFVSREVTAPVDEATGDIITVWQT